MNKKWDFDSWAKSYDKSVLDDDWFHDKYNENLAALCNEIMEFSKMKPCKLLDIGSGTGNLIVMLQNIQNLEIVGCEPSRSMREICIQKCPTVSVIDATLPNLDNLSGKFDIIVSSYVIHHVPRESLGIMVDSLRKLCNSGGLILLLDVMFANEDAFLDEVKLQKENQFHDRVEELLDEYFQYVDQLRTAFIDAGFSVSSHHLSKYIWLLKAHHVSTPNG
jgi:putative AdoMet-dependent methyltransferase